MAIPQGRVLIDDDIDFHVQFIAGMVRLDALNLFYGFCETHGHVEEDVPLVGACGGAREIPDVGCGGAGPVYDYVEGEEETA